MTNIRTDKAIEDAKAEINKQLDEFKNKLDSGTSDPNSFMSLADIERKWKELNDTTSKTYSNMVSAYLSDLDEKALIRSKKENTQKKE